MSVTRARRTSLAALPFQSGRVSVRTDLARTAVVLVWLNPLAAHPDYEPLTRGMRAAVPHTDELLAGNSLASLEQLASILEEM